MGAVVGAGQGVAMSAGQGAVWCSQGAAAVAACSCQSLLRPWQLGAKAYRRKERERERESDPTGSFQHFHAGRRESSFRLACLHLTPYVPCEPSSERRGR